MLQFCTNSYALLNTTCNHHMQPAAAQWRSKKQQQKQQVLFCNIFRFQTHPVSDFFSTMNCRNKRHGCLCAANYCLRTSRSLVLRNQAFAACVGFCVVPRPIKHMSVISQFGTTKVATKQYCNMHQNNNCCSMTRAVARQAVLCVLN
jgi:hypothetical protein